MQGDPRSKIGRDRELNRSVLLLWVACSALAGFSFFLWFPGLLNNDSVGQYQQALSGRVDDWQPPLMARLWQFFAAARSPWPLFALNTTLYWSGFGLLGHSLARTERTKLAWLVVLSGASPLFFFFNRQIITDVCVASALVAAFAVCFRYRASGAKLTPIPSACLIALLSYAALTRANGAFAVSPILLYAAGVRPRLRSFAWWTICLAAVAAILPLTIVLNRSLLGAENSGAMERLQLYDLVGIASNTGDWSELTAVAGTVPPLPRGCYNPILWDTLMTARCDRLWYRLPAPNTPSRARVTYYWLAAIASHPFAYATHRLLHFNAETMFMVPPAPQCIAAPQLHDCFGRTGAGRRIGSELPLSISDYLLKNPLVWPIFWLTIAVSAVALPKRENNPIDLASEVLLGSALLYGGAYLIVGIAMNVRYFYWVYVATQTALLMLLYERRPVWVKRHSVLLIAPLAIVVAVGYGFRIARIETFLN